MAKRPYVPSGKSDPGALPLVLAAAVGGGLAAGIIEGFVSQWLSLLLIYPAILGAVAGGAASAAIGAKRVRMPLAAMAIALVAGLIGETAVHYMKFRHVKAIIPDSDVLSFPQYLQLAAEAGVSITRAGHSEGSSPTLTGEAVFALWGVNFLIVCGIAMYVARSRARAPFCEQCNAWYTTSDAIAVGAGDKAALKATRQRLENGQLADAMRELGSTNGKTASVVLLKGCTKCNAHEPLLELHSVAGVNTSKKQEKTVYTSLITQSEAQAIRAAAPKPGA